MFAFILLFSFLSSCYGQQYLEVRGRDFYYNDEHVFLSGMNIAWERFGYDFGNGRYDGERREALEGYLERISESGGNSIRIWVHCDGRSTPEFDDEGYVIAPDGQGTLINDLTLFVDHAYANNILVFIVLWTGGPITNPFFADLMWEDDKLESYFDNALRPMVRALADKPSLGGWEIMNEPEGHFRIEEHENPCFNTEYLARTGAGWSGEDIPISNVMKFHNWHFDVIREEDPKTLLTQSSWTERTITDNFNFTNLYKDECLVEAGGRDGGVADFYQVHSYAWEGIYRDTAPFNVHADVYNLDKPLLLGEFSQEGSDGRNITTQMGHLYEEGYDGAWTWQANESGNNADDFATQALATELLRDRTTPGGKVDIDLQ